MAIVWITESDGLHRQVADGQARMPAMRPSNTQQFTYFGSTQSTDFGDTTRLIRVIADDECHIEFGANPTATAASLRIPANTVEYFGVLAGERVACYDGVT